MGSGYKKIDSASFIAEVLAYCARTNTHPGDVGRMALNHPGYIGLAQKRGTTTDEARKRVLGVIAEYPDGMDKEAVRMDRLINGPRPPMGSRQTKASLAHVAERALAVDQMPRVSRDPCRVCGARGDYDCGHAKGRWGTSYG